MKSGAQPGNNNAGKNKAWREALDKELKQYVNKDASIERGQALRRIARGVVEAALDGNKDAYQEIANRLDGKPAQSVTVAGDADNPLRTISRIERHIIHDDPADQNS